MTTGTLAIVCGMSALVWSIVLYRGRALWKGRTSRREQRDPTPWAYWGGFLALALALTLPLPPVFVRVDQLAGQPALAYLLGDTAALLTFWTWLAYYQRLNGPDPAAAQAMRRLAWIVAGAVGFMSLRFIVAPGHAHHQLGSTPETIYMALYRLVFLGVIALHLHHTIARLRDYAATTRTYDPALHTRLQLMIWSARFGLAFVGFEGLRVIPPPLPEVGGALLSLTAILLLAAGLTVQTWVGQWNSVADRWARLAERWHWLRHFQAYRYIYPLWHALYPVKPSRSLQWPPKDTPARERKIIYPPLAARWCWWNLPFHLHRQLV